MSGPPSTRTAPTTAGSDPGGLDRAWRDTRRLLRDFIAHRVEDPDTAEDLVQEVLLRLHGRRQADGELSNPSAWLYRVARNVVIDHYRTRRPHLPLDVADPKRVERADLELFAGTPGAVVTELARCLTPLIAHLPPAHREALTLVDLQGRTQADAARVVGVSVSGMKSRVQRGRRRLRDLLTACCAVRTDHRGAVIDYDPPPGCGSRG
ncbi:MAG: sigma-70 family RNA polymerase sigma factor [Actinobacteria bacterium]|nr:sigma-70 family RNA polymerase sigma factor [Actinomycetota bacterium]